MDDGPEWTMDRQLKDLQKGEEFILEKDLLRADPALHMKIYTPGFPVNAVNLCTGNGLCLNNATKVRRIKVR